MENPNATVLQIKHYFCSNIVTVTKTYYHIDCVKVIRRKGQSN